MRLLVYLVTGLLLVVKAGRVGGDHPEGPAFIKEPPNSVDFSNTTGVTIECLATGEPPPRITWETVSGGSIGNLTGVRRVLPNGDLVFPPFKADEFRQDAHSATYRCAATNAAGTILSRDVHVQAVVPQPYDIQVYDVYAIVKTTAVLKCHVPSFLEEHVRITMWLRDEVLIIEPNGIMDGKYAVLPSGELHVRDVELEDSGSGYRCHVKHSLTGETHFSSASGRLYVRDPQGSVPPKITDIMPAVHVTEGETVILPCVAQGHPAPKAEWFAKLNKRQLFPLHIGERVQQTSGALIIHRAQTSDSGTYVCDVSNDSGNDRGETTVTVTASLSVSVKPEKQVVDIGKTASFRCVVVGFPVATVTWYKDGRKLQADAGHALSEDMISIVSVHVTDKGIYQCLVSNSLESAQGAGQLILGDAAPELVGVFDDNTLEVASDISLACVATGSPSPVITWFVDGISLQLSDRVRVIQQSDADGSVVSVLNVTDTRWEDGGSYRCAATNKAGVAEHVARLNIYGRPAIRPLERVTAVAGEDVRLNCFYYGYPITSISWEKDGRSLPFNLRQVAFPNGTVVVRKVQRATDSGKYTCTVANSKGQSAQEHVDLVVMVPPKITPFSFQDELVREGMRARLQCVASEGDAPLSLRWTKDGYPLQEALLAGVIVRDLDDYSSILSISNVTPRHNGNYTCIATNEAASAQHTAQLSVNVPPKIIPFAFLDDQFYMGMRAHITCAVSQGDLPISFSWLKDGEDLPPVLGILTRNYDEHANSLHIESVTSKHTGNYTCIAFNKAASVNYTAPLLVHVAPKIVPFSFQSDHLFEGVLARISCVVYQGDLPLTIRWAKDGLPLVSEPGLTVREIDDYSSILTIESVEQRHSGNFTCLAHNSAATVNYTAELVVNVPPKIVPFTFQDEHLLDGMLVRVSCVVSRGDTPLAIRWEKDGVPLPLNEAGVSVRAFDEYSSVLSIDPLSRSHSGNYTCIASNHAATATFTAPLVVYVPPRWTMEPRDSAVLLGHNLQLDCQADGFPQPKVTWMKTQGATVGEYVEPVETSGDVAVLSNGSLAIARVQEYHGGHYFCKASNGIGDGLSTAVHVTVQVPPRFDVKFLNQSLRRGEGFRLECQPSGDSPMTFSWKKDGVTLDPLLDTRYKMQSLTDSTVSDLTVMEATRIDTGLYTCVAKNVYGTDDTNLQITVFEPPDSPRDIHIRNIGNRTAEVTWTAPFNGHSRIIKYVIEYNQGPEEWEDGLVELAVSGRDTNVTLHGLRPATRYQLRMFAENELGLSSPGDFVSFATKEEPPAGAPLDVEADAVDANTVVVRWRPPEEHLWHGKLRGYSVGYKHLDSSESFTFQNVELPEGDESNHTVNLGNLDKFTKYSVVVAAFNDKGRGPLSEEILVMTSEDVPSQPPLEVRCLTLTSQSIHVTWQPPQPHSINGILRGYKVFYAKVDDVLDDNPVDFKSTTVVRTTLHGLEKYTNYSLRVVGFTRVGDGVPSDFVFCRTMDDVPDVPADVKAIPASKESVLVAWKSPLHSNGVVTKYYVYAKHEDDAEEDAMKHTVPPSALYHEISGLKPEQAYEFWVTAATMIGESPRSKMVSEAPKGPMVPARIAAFDGIVTTLWKTYIRLLCKSVGNPPPERTWTWTPIQGSRSQVVKENERLRVLPDGILLVKNVQGNDSGNYTCQVKNGFGHDQVVYVVNILAPPSAPIINVLETTATSIVLEWKLETDGGTNVQGYTLNYKRESGHWEQRDLAPDSDSYTLNGLKCGSHYQMYMTAFNKIGTGIPSDVITVSTNGTIADTPDKEEFIDEDIDYITLNLQTWHSDACPVSVFVVEYKQHANTNWRLITDDLKAEQQKFVIRDLTPGTAYLLRVTAQNGAGPSTATYDFITLSRQGVSPHNTVHEDPRGILFYLDLRIIIPVAALVFVVVLVLSVMCICANRRENAARKMKGMDGNSSQNGPHRPCLRTDSTVSSFAYMQRHRSSCDGTILRSDTQEKSIPYPTYHLPNLRSSAEFKTFGQRNSVCDPPPPLLPTQNELDDADAHALQHFSRPPVTNLQSFPSPNGKLQRTGHPVAIPTAPTPPPMVDTSTNNVDFSGTQTLKKVPEVPPKPNMVTMETRFSSSPDKVRVRVLPGPPSNGDDAAMDKSSLRTPFITNMDTTTPLRYDWRQ